MSVIRRDNVSKLNFGEDNTATIQVIKAGYSAKLRYMNRTHRIDIAWLSQVFQEVPNAIMYHCPTDRQRADLLTKAFGNADKFAEVRRLVGIVAPGEVPTSYKIAQGGSHQFISDPPGPKVKARAKGRPKAKSKGVRITGEPLNTDGCVAHQGGSAPPPCSASRRDRPLAERVSGMTDIYIHIFYLAMVCRKMTRAITS